MNPMIKNTMALFAITAVSGLLLGAVYEGTKDARAEQAIKTQQNAYREVFAEGKKFEEVSLDDYQSFLSDISYSETEVVIDGLVKACDDTGAEIGYIVNVTAKEGYGGDISFAVGFNLANEVTGISYLSIAETAGLGMKAKDEDFVKQYVDGSKEGSGAFVVNKDGGEGIVIDAIGSATITSRAVTKGVNAARTLSASYMEARLGGAVSE